jgi:hypothetical protein
VTFLGGRGKKVVAPYIILSVIRGVEKKWFILGYYMDYFWLNPSIIFIDIKN